MDKRKVWLVPHPTSQFKEDVKQLAVENRLKVIDAKFADRVGKEFVTDKAPKLTPVKPKVKAEPKPETDK